MGFQLGLYAFIDYINRVYEPIQNLYECRLVSNTDGCGDRCVFELMDTPSEESGEESLFDEGRIEFKDVSFEYTPGVPGVGLEFHGEPKQIPGLIGHTGSGKSSL